MESSEVNEASDEEKGGTAEILAEANRNRSAGKGSDVNEVAKKDPLTRRKELLINSGLAEVFFCTFLSMFYLFCFVSD